MITKAQFCESAEVMRSYAIWERAMYNWGIDFTNTPVEKLAEHCHVMMCDFDRDWSYDAKLELDWILEWTFGESPNFIQTRHGREFDLTEAGALYDFLVFMNEKGWEDGE